MDISNESRPSPDSRHRILFDSSKYLSWRSISRCAITITVMALSFYYVEQEFLKGLSQLAVASLKVNYLLLVTSVILSFSCTLLGGWEWSVLLKGLGASLTVRQALRIHLLSIPPKYVPGFAWQQIGKAYLCTKVGVPKAAIAISMVGELLMILLSGIVVLLFALPNVALPSDNQFAELLRGLPLPAIAVAYSLLVPLLLKLLLQSRLAKQAVGAEMKLSYARLFFVFAAVAFTWVLLGGAFFILTASFYPVTAALIPSSIFALTFSIIVGLIVVFAPMGLGIREGILTFMLSLWIPAPIAAVVAVAARLVFSAGELVGFFLAFKL